MKKLMVFALVLFAAVLVLAQTFKPPQMSSGPPIATSLAQCVTPAAHTASTCPVEDPTSGLISYFNWNGSAWVNGTQGPVGPQGPAGANGIPQAGQSYSENCGQATLTTGSSTSGSLVTHQCTATIP